MFLRLYFYRLKDILLTKEITIWNIFFPVILGTFFYLGFGNLMNGNELKLSPIPAAVVTESENTAFSEVLTSLCEEGDERLFDAVYTDLEAAKTMLNDNDVTGILLRTHRTLCLKITELNRLLCSHSYSSTVTRLM